MEVVIKFKLPEDRRQYTAATKGLNYFEVLKNFEDRLCSTLEWKTVNGQDGHDMDVKTITQLQKILQDIMDEHSVSLQELD